MPMTIVDYFCVTEEVGNNDINTISVLTPPRP